MNDGSFFEYERSDSECYEDCDKDSSNIEVTLHASHCSFHEMVRYYTRFGCTSDRLLPVVVLAMPRINNHFAVAAAWAAVLLSSSAGAHDIPNDVTVQAFFRSSGNRAHLLVRVPL